MKLKNAQVEGYRSIRKHLQVFVEPTVTVVLGPNDHGKTNMMNALLHLNRDSSFGQEDLNWDCAQQSDEFPTVAGSFTLSESERMWLLEAESEARKEINARILERDEEPEDEEDDEDELEPVVDTPAAATPAEGTVPPQPPTPASPEQSPPATTDDEVQDEEIEPDEVEEDDELPDEPLGILKLSDVPESITLSRSGLSGDVVESGLEEFQSDVRSEFERYFPRLELIDPITNLADSVSAEELGKGENEFMRGIFYYAGLDPDDSSDLFAQSDRTQMAITRASELLNKTLKESWSQGKSLRFRLTHNSKEERIDLQIEDPSVESTYVRASRRSSGFTHYFSLKTILHSRQQDNPAESYILLFDEPGLFLHPSGQFDLLQVLETPALESQVMYVTHSLFMINKTFPTRHRLIMKNKSGTMIDGKPYVGRWQSVLSALGLTLTGSILFANHVVLTEGDSDPIYIYAMIQKAVKTGKANLDINSLAVMSTSESKNTDVLLRLLWESNPKPKVALLSDGDKGGKDRLDHVATFLKDNEIPNKPLSSGTSIEDHVPLIREVYVPAVAAYVGKLMVMLGKAKPDEDQLDELFMKSFDARFEKGKVTVGVANWADTAAQEIGEIKGKPSKVGIAREYASRLLDLPDDEYKHDNRAKALIDWVQKEAGVPEQHPVDQRILEE